MKGKNNVTNDSIAGTSGNKRTNNVSGDKPSGTIRTDEGAVSTTTTGVIRNEIPTTTGFEQSQSERNENSSVRATDRNADREARKFIRPDGSTGYRRNRRGSNDNRTTAITRSNGTGSGASQGNNRAETGELAIEVEAPPIIKQKRQTAKRKAEAEFEKLALVTALGTGVKTIFHALSYKLGQHWKLTDDETAELSVDLDNALSTLPGESYAIILSYCGKVAPWLALAITANGILAPRIEQQRLNRNAKTRATKDSGVAREQQTKPETDWGTNSFPFDLSAGGKIYQ